MPQLDQRLMGLAESRPPRGVGPLIQRLENEVGNRPLRRSSPAVHPIGAMALAAIGIFVFVGGVAVGHWAFGSVGLFDIAFGSADQWITNTDISVLAAVVAGSSGASVLLIGALSLTWRWRSRRRAYRSLVDLGGVMDTIEKGTDRPVSTDATGHTNRWLAVGLVLALAALAGLGAWLLVDNYVASDLETLIDDVYAAYTAGDGEAAAAYFSASAVVVDSSGLTHVGREQIVNMVRANAGFGLDRIERAGEIIANGPLLLVPERAIWGATTYLGASVVHFNEDLNLITRWTVGAAVQDTSG